MTIYPNWTQVSCPVCKARVHEPCTAIYTLPTGITLRYPHQARLIAHEQSQFKPDAKDEKIRGEGEVLSPGTTSNKT